MAIPMKQTIIFTDNSTLLPGELEEGDLYLKEGHDLDGYEGDPEEEE